MRLTVITDNKMISLGMFAKDIFSDIVLTVDKTDNSFNVVQYVAAANKANEFLKENE